MHIEIPTAKSLFIEMLFQEKLLASGTAILVANDQKSHCALITNRHNVTGRNQDTGECLHRLGATPDSIVIHFHKYVENFDDIGQAWKKVKLPLYREDGEPYWIEHPVIAGKADIVALNLTWGNDIMKVPYYLGVDLDGPDMLVSPAESVSVIGFPFGLSSYGKLPIWATGFLAQELSLMTPEDPVFLIDCRTRQGQSGSPVIAFRPTGYRKIVDGRIVSTLNSGSVWEFLGVYSGRVNAESDLGRVWHVSAIRELLDEAETDKARRPMFAKEKEQRNNTRN